MSWLWVVFVAQLMLIFMETTSGLAQKGMDICFNPIVGVLTTMAFFSYLRLVRIARDTVARFGTVVT
jgi:hypothetical protein